MAGGSEMVKVTVVRAIALLLAMFRGPQRRENLPGRQARSSTPLWFCSLGAEMRIANYQANVGFLRV